MGENNPKPIDKMAALRAKVEAAKLDKEEKKTAELQAAKNAEELAAQESARILAEREAQKIEAREQIDGIARDTSAIENDIGELQGMIAELSDDDKELKDELLGQISAFETEIAELSQGARYYETQLADGPEATVDAEGSQEVSLESFGKLIDTLKSGFRSDIDSKKVTPDELATQVGTDVFELSPEFNDAVEEAIQEILNTLISEEDRQDAANNPYLWKTRNEKGELSPNFDLNIIINWAGRTKESSISIHTILEKHKDVFLRALTEHAERLAKMKAISPSGTAEEMFDPSRKIDSYLPKNNILITDNRTSFSPDKKAIFVPESLQKLDRLLYNLNEYSARAKRFEQEKPKLFSWDN